MDIKEHTTPARLERYAFLWSLLRMVIASVSLFFGAMPIAYKILGYSSAVSLLPLFWLISGAAAVYLSYLWFSKADQKVFGGSDTKDKVAFLIMAVTGINLGFAAIGSNIGMNLVWDMPISNILFKATAVVYLFVAFYLWKRWKENDEQLFDTSSRTTKDTDTPPTKETSSEQPQDAE